MLAVGDSTGTLHILEIPWSLSHSSSSEVGANYNTLIISVVVYNGVVF